jgi:hypothetical protein
MEGTALTSLVGLSVDFCIHMATAFHHAHAHPLAPRIPRRTWLQGLSEAPPPGLEQARCATAALPCPCAACHFTVSQSHFPSTSNGFRYSPHDTPLLHYDVTCKPLSSFCAPRTAGS